MPRIMNIAPARGSRILLAAIPFVLILIVYIVGSAERRAANPDDKLLPPISEMAETTKRLATEPDRRSGDYVLWTDTAASLQRLALGLGISTLIGLGFGLTVGLLPIAGASFGTMVAVISMIPPMAVLPILFIVFGLGELSKVMLIIIGVAPCLIRDMSIEVQSLPREQMIKAQTLGASTWQVAIRVVLPQIMPRLIKSVRLMLGPAFLFLISAEAIAADVGLGYRIFLVRRYLSMDVILPYVAWITLLAFALDLPARPVRAQGLPLGLCRGAALMSALSFRNVWVEYGEQIVLERINIEIASGTFLSVVGPSGAGKSTFLRLILGQERPSQGAVLLDGEPFPAEPGPDRGIVFQRYSVFPHLTVLGNVLVGYEFEQRPFTARLFGAARRAGDRKKRSHDRERSGLREHRDKYPSALSGGMQQRLAIAQALARRPRVLLLDEPFGALDPGTRAQMHALIKPLWRDLKMTIVMVTHDIREAFGLATRLIALDRPRRDPQAQERYGAKITYDLDLTRDGAVPVLGFLQDRGRHRLTMEFSMFLPLRARWSRHAGLRPAPQLDAPPSSRFRQDGDARLEGARGRRQAAGDSPGARSGNGRSTWACPAPKASPTGTSRPLRAASCRISPASTPS